MEVDNWGKLPGVVFEEVKVEEELVFEEVKEEVKVEEELAALESEGEEEDAERWRNDDEEDVLGLGVMDVDDDVLGLGIDSTRAAATEPPIWRRNIIWF